MTQIASVQPYTLPQALLVEACVCVCGGGILRGHIVGLQGSSAVYWDQEGERSDTVFKTWVMNFKYKP